jgi:ubiquinone/menaquinone biosynthesis C-methylase UbiE
VNDRVTALGRRYARVATRAAVAYPRLWWLFRPLMRWNFDSLASKWDEIRGPEAALPVLAALDRLDETPRTVLDVGTGTGFVAGLAAERFPEAEVVGVDLSPRMVELARRSHPGVRFEVADASRLPFRDGSFGLVLLLNMIPFADELARVTRAGGRLAIAFSHGPETPIWAPPETIRAQLAAAGFDDVDELAAGTGTALLARRR